MMRFDRIVLVLAAASLQQKRVGADRIGISWARAPPPRWSPSNDPQGADDIRARMAEYGEWNRKGAVLSDKTAQKEYGVTRDLIVKGVQTGKLEYREGAVWGNPYLRVLRSQLELYIAEQLGSEYLASKKAKTELRVISKEIVDLGKELAELEARKAELERAIKT
jgi:hypothetical protein